MTINVRMNDSFEIRYLNKDGEANVEFLPLELAKEFVTAAHAQRNTISTVTYSIGLLIDGVEPNRAYEPSRRFSECQFAPDEILHVSQSWVDEARTKATAEIDAYIAEHHGGARPIPDK